MTTIEEMTTDINKDYDIEIVVKRKSDGHGARISIKTLHEAFKADFLSQFIYSIRNTEKDPKDKLK
jgi:hypothetical protein